MNTQIKSDRAAWLQGASAQCSPLPSETQTPWRLILLGAPGVGKGTQAELLHHRLGACHPRGGGTQHLRTISRYESGFGIHAAWRVGAGFHGLGNGQRTLRMHTLSRRIHSGWIPTDHRASRCVEIADGTGKDSAGCGDRLRVAMHGNYCAHFWTPYLQELQRSVPCNPATAAKRGCLRPLREPAVSA
jgi:hypothetical protein